MILCKSSTISLLIQNVIDGLVNRWIRNINEDDTVYDQAYAICTTEDSMDDSENDEGLSEEEEDEIDDEENNVNDIYGVYSGQSLDRNIVEYEEIDRTLRTFPVESVQFKRLYFKYCANAKLMQSISSKIQNKNALRESIDILTSKQKIRKNINQKNLDALQAYLCLASNETNSETLDICIDLRKERAKEMIEYSHRYKRIQEANRFCIENMLNDDVKAKMYANLKK